MKKFQIVSLTLAAALLLAGCGASESAAASGSSSEAVSTVETAPAESESESEAPAAEAALPDDIYTADFNTDSSMFHVNEACNGKGTLTVENGEMTMHVSLQSQKIVNLYLGMAADAPDHEDEWLQPTIDTVTYSDGTSDEVYGFDIPVAAVDTDFQLAILGTKGTWYDHVVSVSNAVPAVDGGDAAAAEVPADGTYTCAVTLEGGSGRAAGVGVGFDPPPGTALFRVFAAGCCYAAGDGPAVRAVGGSCPAGKAVETVLPRGSGSGAGSPGDH